MTDVLDTLKSYPDDASIMMSKRVVADVVDEIARLRVERDALRAELAAERERAEAHFLATREADDELATIRAEREFRDFGYTPGGRKLNIGERIKHAESRAALNKGGGDV